MRKAYLLTTNKESMRTQFSTDILMKIGFEIIVVQHIPHEDKVYSNTLSMIHIYKMIRESGDEYAYVFEDDINWLEHVQLDEIIQYENISPVFFYLGVCLPSTAGIKDTGHIINGHPVMSVSNNVRGLHAIGLSKEGVKQLLEFVDVTPFRFMDMILEKFTIMHSAPIVRYDLQSYIWGHRGILYQDRRQFPTTI
jgi:hypothetical protein